MSTFLKQQENRLQNRRRIYTSELALTASVYPDEHRERKAAIGLPATIRSLGRIARGTYEQCVDCDDLIGEERLIVIPAAERCVLCQELHERSLP